MRRSSFVVDADRVAVERGREPALRADGQAFTANQVAGLTDPLEERIRGLQVGPFGCHETEDDRLVVGYKPKRVETAGALVVVLQQQTVGVDRTEIRRNPRVDGNHRTQMVGVRPGTARNESGRDRIPGLVCVIPGNLIRRLHGSSADVTGLRNLMEINMSSANHPVGGTPFAALSTLRGQLHLAIPALVVGEGHPESASILAELRIGVDRIEALLATVEPKALAAIRAGFAHAAAGEYRESRTELLTAYHRLSVLLLDDRRRRADAVNEPTKRWHLDR